MVDPTRHDLPEALPESAASEAAASTETAGQPDEAGPSLEELLHLAEQKATEEREARLRVLAEADNVRKRAQTDIAAAHKYAVEKFAVTLLPVKDSLEMTLAVPRGTESDALRSGVELTLKQLAAAFEKFQVTDLNPVGEKFDPHRHQAMSMVEADQPVNTVVQVFQKGYLLADRVIRPALVSVAKAKAQAVETKQE